MKALLIVAGLFFSIFGGVVAYYAASDPGHEYDFNFVLPIDARQMPKPFIPPSISYGEVEQTPPGWARRGRRNARPSAAQHGVRKRAALMEPLRSSSTRDFSPSRFARARKVDS